MIINYSTDNNSMGDTSDQNCDKFREWAKEELEREYPDYDITVSDEQKNLYTDDIDNEDEIIDFCSRLWDNCPWDWC